MSTWREVLKKTEPGSSQWCLVAEQETMGSNWNTGGSVWMSGNTFSCEGEWSLAKVTQNGSGFSYFGGIQKLFGHDPGHPFLSGTAWAGRVGQDDL